ncbi:MULTISPECIES: DUF2188 domain-containing protein [Saccharopolyspora]|uniref:DUF2188 domain-containing protein n=1 Tax=Saccharopolyspora elongata TaxID=2530387 RepID=A0A4R4YXF1_9PSEU|nr:DUF2188 domain-containing protein [Saccharopolyspora elongata]TDD50168.1 DUF2188 domain-containing protein [Saccharopolyspora elongata]
MAERHVVRDHAEGTWKVVDASTGKTESRTRTQAGAIAEAADKARRTGGGDVVIHGFDGEVNEKRTVAPAT